MLARQPPVIWSRLKWSPRLEVTSGNLALRRVTGRTAVVSGDQHREWGGAGSETRMTIESSAVFQHRLPYNLESIGPLLGLKFTLGNAGSLQTSRALGTDAWPEEPRGKHMQANEGSRLGEDGSDEGWQSKPAPSLGQVEFPSPSPVRLSPGGGKLVSRC